MSHISILIRLLAHGVLATTAEGFVVVGHETAKVSIKPVGLAFVVTGANDAQASFDIGYERRAVEAFVAETFECTDVTAAKWIVDQLTAFASRTNRAEG